jgi:hypothetical protein
MAGEPGALATRAESDSDATAAEPVFSPKDFRLNLGGRLTVATELTASPTVALRLGVATEDPVPTVAAHLGVVDNDPLPNLDSPAIRKLTWEHVVPDRPASSAPSAATLVPLPPPRRVPPPPPQPVATFEPPAPVIPPQPVVDHLEPEIEIVDDGVEDVVIDEFVDDEVVDEELEVEEEVEEVVEVEQAVHAATSATRAEVNRLGSIPDAFDDDDDTPIELPPITPSGPVVASPQATYSPVLAETLYIPLPSRPATTMVAAITGEPGRKNKKKAKVGRKQKRHLFRTFMTLVLLFGLLAGGAFAAKKYLLKELTWSSEVKPLADEVAATRGLEFKAAVEVTPLPVADYAARLAASTIDMTPETAPTWRALGLLNGELDLAAVGRQAMNDSPAFYDPATKAILVSQDLQLQTHLYKFAIHRALTVALLDQQYGWSGRAATATPAAAFAIRATIDGDALAVANTLATSDGSDLLGSELVGFVQSHETAVSPSQYAAAVAGRMGVATRPKIASLTSTSPALETLEKETPASDDVFDAGRSPAIVASPPGTQGMMFWYYVLASRIDDAQAWSAATHWLGDSLTTSTDATNQCVDVKIAAADANGQAVLLGAFGAWAAVAPAESTTTVAPMEGNQIAIRACDPGAAITAALPARVPVAFGGAGVEQALVQAAVSAAAGTGTVDGKCLVNAARLRGAALVSPADEAPVLAVGWQPAYVAANLDLAAGCVTAAPVGAAPVDPAAAPPVDPAAAPVEAAPTP